MNDVIRGFKYRFYPTPEQETALSQTFGSCRYVYNWALGLRTKAWYESQERTNYAETSAALTKLKKQPETDWLNNVSCVPTQQALRHLQTAFVNFWEKRNGYPSFKKKSGKQSAEFTRSAFTWDEGVLSLAKIGVLSIKWSRCFTGFPSTVTVSRTASGRYYVSLLVDEPIKPIGKASAEIGIDLGLMAFATTSTGSKFQAPRPLKRKLAHLKRAQKALSRKQKGSKNRNKARLKVAKIHQKISDTRNDFLHKLTTKLVRENQTIVMEDLDVRGMMSNPERSQAIGDSGWYELARQLKYKCEWYEREFLQIDRFYPSTQLCSSCSFRNRSLTEADRTWTCPECGGVHDRDVNAAINIVRAGQAQRACGGTVRPGRLQKRTGGSHRSTNHSVKSV